MTDKGKYNEENITPVKSFIEQVQDLSICLVESISWSNKKKLTTIKFLGSFYVDDIV
jgi:hypothetical protein